MHLFEETRIVPYSSDLIYDIVLDIEKYPDFLPWCSKARILRQEANSILAELHLVSNRNSESYVSQVVSKKTSNGYIINVEAVSGSFKYLKNIWELNNCGSSCEVKFFIEFELKSKLLDMIVGVVFSLATKKMISAFELRAKQLSAK